jgi:hypothetical protein
VFDLWNNELSSSGDYGRFRIELNTSSAGNFASSKAFRAIIHSGSNRQEVLLGDYTTTASFISQEWTHFAFATSKSTIKLYKNGELDSSAAYGTDFGNVSGTLNAFVGALITNPSGSTATTGSGKLSGSIDEFRYWKTTRTERDIERNWYTNVYGGTNTDDANTDLGVYFKFNEGITGDTTTDATVLDYSGRISNGTWTGYTPNSRNVGSAIVSASAAEKEFKDPILRTTNPLYVDYLQISAEKGHRHDLDNSSVLYDSFPAWILEEDEGESDTLKKFIQIVSSYLDTLHVQIKYLNKIKNIDYTTQTSLLNDKPKPFASYLLEEKGVFVQDLFVESTLLEQYSQKIEGKNLESDLFDLKNLIYQNIYNNLTNIAKKKGTQAAIYDTLRTFGVDNDLVKLKTYIGNQELALKDETKKKTRTLKYINFYNVDTFTATMFQTGSNSNELAYISSSADKNKLCLEGFVNFPIISYSHYGQTPKPGANTSLFGFKEIDTTDPSLTLEQSSPSSSLFVRVVKSRNDGKEKSYFEVSSSVAGVPQLTSSNFNDLYEDTNWYLAVQLEPENSAILFPSSSIPDYSLKFSGYSYAGTTIADSFSVSGTVARQIALDFIQTNQKVYAGSRRTNFTGSVEENTDIKFGGLRYWLRNLTDEEQKKHAIDFENVGGLQKYNNNYSIEASVREFDLEQSDYNILDWTFETITQSDSLGQFEILDITSGSASTRTRGSYVQALKGFHHRGLGYGFRPSQSDTVQNFFIDSHTPTGFDEYNSDNLIDIKNELEESRPFKFNNGFVDRVTTIEKSAQVGIDEEILKMLGSVKELASYFGKPVDKYRKEYKDLRFLREKFFAKVSNDIDSEKFLSFYKWIDSSLHNFLKELVPATANFNEDVFNVIESHVLERNKYQTKFPTLELRQPDPIDSAESLDALLVNWRLNHAPIPEAQDTNCEWWKLRVERSNPTITSGDSNVDADREQIRLVKLSSANRSYTTPQSFKVDDFYTGKDTRKATYWDSAIKEFGAIAGSESEDYLVSYADDVASLEDCNDVVDPNKKVRMDFKVQNNRESNESYSYGKGHLLPPYTMWSSSVDTGYQANLSSNFKTNIGINNQHDDTYSKFRNAPLQSPFTEGWVGGRQYRHNALNNGSDAFGTRPEGFYLTLTGSSNKQIRVTKTSYTNDGTADSDTPRASLFREELAKRPINIANRQYSTASSRLGNFRNEYEVVMINGRTKNNLWFHDNFADVLSQTEIWNLNLEGRPAVAAVTAEAASGQIVINDNSLSNETLTIPYTSVDSVTFTYKPSPSDPLHIQIGASINDTAANTRTKLESADAAPLNTLLNVGGSGATIALEFKTAYVGADRNNTITSTAGGKLSLSGFSGGVDGVDYEPVTPYANGTLPTREVVKSVIVNRFSAPGGPEIQSRGYLEPTGEEFSPCNAYPFRNTSVIYSSGSGNNDFTGALGPRVNIHTNIHTQNDGLRVLLSRRRGKYGVDSVFGTVRELDYDTVGSYHKIYDNPISQSTGINYDNFFVSHQIPRTPASYSWVASALNGSSGSFSYSRNATVPIGSTSQAVPFAELISSIERTTTDNRAFTGLFSGSSTPTSAVLTSSLYASMVDRGTTEITNELTAPNVGLDNFHVYTHAINNSIFGNNSFSQIRGGDTRQARSLRENNIISFRSDKTLTKQDWLITNLNIPAASINYPIKNRISRLNIGSPGGQGIDLSYSLANDYETFPITTKQTERLLALTNLQNIPNKKRTVYDFVSDSYTNETTNATLINITYAQPIWPKTERTYLKENRQRTQFAINWWSTGRSTRDRASDPLLNSLGNNVLSQSIWVLDGVSDVDNQPKDLFDYSGSFTETDLYSRKNLFSAGELNNNTQLSYLIVGMPNGQTLGSRPFANNHWKKLYMDSQIRPGVQYARDFTSFTGSLIFSASAAPGNNVDYFVPHQTVGGTPWSAAEEAGKEPFYYEDYDAYIQEARSAGKEYSVIPEFRISETIDQILTGKEGESTILSPMLSITGGFVADDTESNFYADYTNSDFLKYFNIIKDKHDSAGIENQGTLRLSCEAIKKFLPYEGFYPAQRVVQLGTLFSQSFSDVITISGEGNPYDTGASNLNNGGSFRTAMAPFYSPGILCNSIKSGISVGYPVFTSSFDPELNVTGTYLSNSSGTSVYDDEGPRISGSFNYRLPFESITDPLAYITTMVDSEPDPTAIIISTASYDSSRGGSPLYSYAINNFLAETMNLFLKNRSVSSLVSAGENDFSFDPRKEYRMKVRVFEEDMDIYSGSKSYGPAMDDSLSLNGTRASYLPFLPPYDIGSATEEEGVELVFNPTSVNHGVEFILGNLTESFTIYEDLSTSPGVSLALDGRTKITDSIQLNRKVKVGDSSRAVQSAPEYAISIQPKWESPVLDFSHRTASISVASNTQATHVITVNSAPVSVGKRLTISDGFSDVEYTFVSGTPGDYEIQRTSGTGAQAQNILDAILVNDSSIKSNFTAARVSNVVTLTAIAPGKFPSFSSSTNFIGIDMVSTNGTGFYNGSSKADNYYVGMWHQYGRIPAGTNGTDRGIKMQITEPILTDTTGSLAKALGFNTLPVKLGEIADSRTVKEAIVAIPYRMSGDDKILFEIDNDKARLAKRNIQNDITAEQGVEPVEPEYLSLLAAMKDYVFPPKYDFYYRDIDDVAPIAMFVFEFGMELKSQDLADIWQNLPPTSTSGKKDITSGIEKTKSTFQISYGTPGSWFANGLPEGTRWMVFKVKQRAAYDYYEQARNSSLAKGYEERVSVQGAFVNPTYSYNWPYDFFSFVELAKVKADLTIVNKV